MAMKNSQIDYVAPLNCRKCKRLADFIDSHRAKKPEWHNNPVPSFGPITAPILILGLAPGLRGANATGRPFTGDFAGQVLYDALLKTGFAAGAYQATAHDGIRLKNVRIANAVRCVPPQNKPNAAEIATCRPYLSEELAQMKNLRVILALGRIAHDTILRHFELRFKDFPFRHNHLQNLPNGQKVLSSYHCSRYNVQTNRLSLEMFDEVFTHLRSLT